MSNWEDFIFQGQIRKTILRKGQIRNFLFILYFIFSNMIDDKWVLLVRAYVANKTIHVSHMVNANIKKGEKDMPLFILCETFEWVN